MELRRSDGVVSGSNLEGSPASANNRLANCAKEHTWTFGMNPTGKKLGAPERTQVDAALGALLGDDLRDLVRCRLTGSWARSFRRSATATTISASERWSKRCSGRIPPL